jgi:methylenetetrahydrofolate reductase (NADPH)
MNLRNAYGPGKFGLSFELYPPKTEPAEAELFEHVAELMNFRPDYITCTYGAGGSTRSKTLDIVERVRRDFRGATASHLTCVGATVEQLRDYLVEAEKRGVSNIVALRGDPPKGETEFRQVAGGLRYANELVALIKAEFPQFGIAVAGYPEKHLEAPSLDIDLANLKRKVDSGADAVVTQLFYRNEDFFEFRRRCEQLGITVPIVPGILPVTNLAQIKRITSLCGAQLPEEFRNDLERCGADAEAQFEVGVAFAAKQVRELIASGVPGIHFYVLNKSNATGRVLREVALTR